MAFIKLTFKFQYGLYSTNNNQDGLQNGRHLSVSALVVTLSPFNLIFSKLHIWMASIKLSLSLNTGFARRIIAKMANKMAAAYKFAFVDTLP